jgi:murein L,D-transpeptidase YcbB/YkuD
MSGYSYAKSKGDELYRRGLYVYWRRSTVYPSFITLDAPTREFCSAQRARTSTPLQSLVLMNDPVFVEAARAFAQRILKEGGADDAARLRYAWRTALSRSATDKEIAILGRTLETQLATYAQDKAAAAALVKVGDLAKPSELDDSQLAAWTAVANVLLNLNETISN